MDYESILSYKEWKQDNYYKKHELNLKMEQANLDRCLRFFKNKLEQRENESTVMTSPYLPGDPEYVTDSQLFKKRLQLTSEAIDTYKKIINEPYFKKLVYDNNGKIITMYLGNLGFYTANNEEFSIQAWQMIDVRNERDFIIIKNKKYNLLLNRNIIIRNGKLIDIEDVYVRGETLLSIDKKSDQHLKKILELRKTDSNIKSIISSIQDKQMQIMNYPFNESFVCQGIAGSGKTMIMLHRLSIYAFRNGQDSLKKVKMILPNEILSNSISALCNELYIEDIERFTLSKYYKYLLNKMNNEFTKILWKDNSQYSNEDFDKIKPSADNMIDEANEKFLSIINIERLNEILEENGIKGIPKENISLGMYNSLKQNLRKIIDQYLKIDGVKACLKSIYNGFEWDHTFKSNIKYKKMGIINECNRINNTLKPEKLVYNSDNIRELIKKIFKDVNELLLKYNFIDKVIKNFKDLVSKLDSIVLDNEAKLKEYEKNTKGLKYSKHLIAEAENELKDKEKLLKSTTREKSLFGKTTREIFLLTKRIEELKLQCITFSNKKLEGETINKIKDYSTSLKICKDVLKKVKANESDLLVLNEAIVSLDATVQKAKYLSFVYDEIDGLSLKTIYDTILRPFIKKNYPNLEFKRGNYYYDFELYYILVLAVRLNLNNYIDDNLICIDEAQELSELDYRLIRNLNKSTTRYNFYGDIKQQSSRYGISSWDDLARIIEIKRVYELNENYRNTTNICKYYNKALNRDDIAVGLDGVDVRIKEITLMDLGAENLKSDCIIIKYLNSNIYKIIGINETKRNVRTIDDVRGCEFSSVVVVDNGMTENEKYVAYTRATNKLTILHIH